jgi:hypothetical protein
MHIATTTTTTNYGPGEGYTLATGTSASLDVWIAVARLLSQTRLLFIVFAYYYLLG